MIKSKLELNKNGNPIVTQRVIIICDECNKEINLLLYAQIKGLKTYGKDLCRGCKQKEQIKKGIRGKQYVNAGNAARKLMSGKTYEEMYGKEKSLLIKLNQSKQTSGENNANYGGSWHGINPGFNQKGKTIDEIYGKEKADIIREKLSKKSTGENNPMYGKPTPIGSGNGWSGWYNGWYFRSLRELSYMINVIERFNLKWENAEKRKYEIKYLDYKGTPRTYRPDFLIENKYLVEIKPKKLWNSSNIKKKKEAAIIFCNEYKLKYKLISPRMLSFEEINILVEQTKLEFLDRYKKKFDEWKLKK